MSLWFKKLELQRQYAQDRNASRFAWHGSHQGHMPCGGNLNPKSFMCVTWNRVSFIQVRAVHTSTCSWEKMYCKCCVWFIACGKMMCMQWTLSSMEEGAIMESAYGINKRRGKIKTSMKVKRILLETAPLQWTRKYQSKDEPLECSCQTCCASGRFFKMTLDHWKGGVSKCYVLCPKSSFK